MSVSGALPLQVPAPGPPTSFTVRVDLADGRLEVAGQLDHHTAPLVHDAVSVLAASECECWSMDVTGLAGRDEDCLRAIGSTYRRALRTGHRMRLIGAPPSLQRALCRVRLDAHLLPVGAQ
jgi:anti-anti-sigma regulatory factor